jgi:hypothetical protein
MVESFEEVVGEGDTPTGFMGGVVGFGEDEDVMVVCGSEVFDVHNGGVEAAAVEGNEVEWLGGVAVRAEVRKESQPVSNQLNLRLQVFDSVSAVSDDDDMLL